MGCQAERFRGFQIDRQFVFVWCLHGQITRFFSRREQAAQTYQIEFGNRSIFVSYSCSARKVSQLATFPDFRPVMNQCVRCSEEPCVKRMAAGGYCHPGTLRMSGRWCAMPLWQSMHVF